MGTEFKCVVDGLSGLVLWLEIQEGRDRMRSKEYQELGTTAACTMRGVKGTEGYNIFEQQDDEQVTTKRCYYGDSWFGSVKTAANIGKAGHSAVFMI